jgi:choline kinase
MKPSLCILAAGIGSRFGGLKQMKPVGPDGELLIDYSIFDAHKAGFGRIVFVISKKIEHEFKGYMEERYGIDAGFVYAYQELHDIPKGYSVPEGRAKPWGTAHAVLAARSAADVPFGVINADDYYGPGSLAVLYRALENMMPDAAEFVMVGFELEKTLSEHGAVSRGICSVENGYLASVVEREKIRRSGSSIMYATASGEENPLDPRTTVSMNCWGFAPKTFFPLLEKDFVEFLNRSGKELKSECYLPAVVNNGLAHKKISVKMLYSGERWFGMTYADDCGTVREYLQKKIKEGAYPSSLFG